MLDNVVQYMQWCVYIHPWFTIENTASRPNSALQEFIVT